MIHVKKRVWKGEHEGCDNGLCGEWSYGFLWVFSSLLTTFVLSLPLPSLDFLAYSYLLTFAQWNINCFYNRKCVIQVCFNLRKELKWILASIFETLGTCLNPSLFTKWWNRKKRTLRGSDIISEWNLIKIIQKPKFDRCLFNVKYRWNIFKRLKMNQNEFTQTKTIYDDQEISVYE